MGVPVGVFGGYRKGVQDKDFDFLADDFISYLLDASDLSTIFKAVTGATNATPIVVTATSHGFSDGDEVLIGGVVGNTNANGRFFIANSDANTFELQAYDEHGALVDVAGNAAYTSGGYVIKLNQDLNEDDFTAGVEETSGSLTSPATGLDGSADFGNVTFSSASGNDVDAFVTIWNTGSAGSKTAVSIEIFDTPKTLNGGDVTYQVASGGMFKL